MMQNKGNDYYFFSYCALEFVQNFYLQPVMYGYWNVFSSHFLQWKVSFPGIKRSGESKVNLKLDESTTNAMDAAALIRFHMNGLQPFESTIEQTTETTPLATKQ